MPLIKRRYWHGNEGPFLQVVDTDAPVAPFRFESISEARARLDGHGTTGITVIRGETGRGLTQVDARPRVSRRTGVTDLDPITASDYSSYRAAHFNAFQSAAP